MNTASMAGSEREQDDYQRARLVISKNMCISQAYDGTSTQPQTVHAARKTQRPVPAHLLLNLVDEALAEPQQAAACASSLAVCSAVSRMLHPGAVVVGSPRRP